MSQEDVRYTATDRPPTASYRERDYGELGRFPIELEMPGFSTIITISAARKLWADLGKACDEAEAAERGER